MAQARLEKLGERLRSSYWFLPGLLTLGGVALAGLAGLLDASLHTQRLGLIEWLNVNEAAGARAILTTIAGSMITVVSLTFSITIVALTLTASQFGPHLLYSFMRDRRNQLVLGVLVATFIYCLLILRLVEEGQAGIPHLSVAIAIALALLSIALLIYFLHHIAQTLQASAVVSHLGAELLQTVQAVFPAATPGARDERAEAEHWRARAAADGDCCASSIDGMLQAVDGQQLAELAEERDLLIVSLPRIGQFVVRGDPLARVHPAGRLDQQAQAQLRKAFLLGGRRTLVQDVGFAFQQLVEVAVRALSPAINAPFTVSECLERLRAGLVELQGRSEPARVHRDAGGQVRLVLSQPTYPQLLDSALEPIRWHARDNLPVLLHLVEVLAGLGRQAVSAEQREALRGQLQRVYAAAQQSAQQHEDRERLEQAYGQALSALS